MNQYRRLIDRFKNRRPLLNIILDGYGIGKKDFTDGIFLSQKPFLDSLFSNRPLTKLFTHGTYVGLPNDKDMGGSEVGHLTLGAGQVIEQGSSVIRKMLKDGSFFLQPALVEALLRGKETALHLLGLLSDGNVHSHIDHFFAVMEEANRVGVKKCYLHVLLDGRDTPIQSALDYVEKIETLCQKIKNQNPNRDYRIVSGGGRETITMDRDQNWAKVKWGYDTHVKGLSGNDFPSVQEAVLSQRSKKPGMIDQDLLPFNIYDEEKKKVTIQSGDSVVMMNFRADRAIEITRALVEPGFSFFPISSRPEVYFSGLMIYDEDTQTPKNVIVRGAKVENPFGKRILSLGLRQFRLAETQKFPHVTFFYNGGYRNPLDPKMEDYFLIPSDRVASFAEKPAMKAKEIADKAISLLDSNLYDYGLINFANPDMVGHTGDIEAVKLAIAAVDKALERVLKKVEEKKGLAIITADHGNADEMLILNPKTQQYEPSTKHSLNLVPFTLFDPLYEKDAYQFLQQTPEKPLTLANVAATNFIVMGRPVPDDLNASLFDV